MSDGLEQFIKVIEINYGDILSDNEVSELLGVSKMYLCKLRRKEGEAIPYMRVGKLIKYFKSDLINWLRLCKGNSDGTNYISGSAKAKKEAKQVQSS